MVLNPSCIPSLMLPANLLRGHFVSSFRSLIGMLDRAGTRTICYCPCSWPPDQVQPINHCSSTVKTSFYPPPCPPFQTILSSHGYKDIVGDTTLLSSTKNSHFVVKDCQVRWIPSLPTYLISSKRVLRFKKPCQQKKSY